MQLDPLHARYPFFGDAREAVQAADVSLESLVERGAPAVDRGRERVERALLEGTTAPETPGRWDVDDELLSYPIARVLVSLLDVPAAVEKYATAEAATARDRIDDDLARDANATLRSVDRPSLSLDQLLREFDLAGDVAPDRRGAGGTDVPSSAGAGPVADDDRYRIEVGQYLRLSTADWGTEWRLAVRELADGEVRVSGAELRRMLGAAVRDRVIEGLPFDVRSSAAGEAIADALADEVDALRLLLSDRDPRPPTDDVRPGLFPPCIAGLVERARDGESLGSTAAFTVQAFLTDLGMDADAVVGMLGGVDADAVATRDGYLADRSRSQYPAPSCETLQAYGDCPGPDARCETITSPLGYYADAVAEADGDVDAGVGGPPAPGADDGPDGTGDGDATVAGSGSGAPGDDRGRDA